MKEFSVFNLSQAILCVLNYSLYRALALMATRGIAYSKSLPRRLLGDTPKRWSLAQWLVAGSHPDGPAYSEVLLKNKTSPHGSYNLHQAFSLIATRGTTYSGFSPRQLPLSGGLLKDGDSPNDL